MLQLILIVMHFRRTDMAYADYTHCAKCDTKVYYDAGVNYDWNTGAWYALCIACAKTHELVLRDKETKEELEPKNIFLDGLRSDV